MVVKRHLGIPINQLKADPLLVLEKLDTLSPNYSFEILNDLEFVRKFADNVQAATDPDKGVIYLRESVYNQAAEGAGRDRYTIMHEVFHLIKHHATSVTYLYRADIKETPLYRNPEWQAKCFAGEFLMPYDMIRNMNEFAISSQCGVTLSAAKYQKAHI